jgi:hypothetical protein
MTQVTEFQLNENVLAKSIYKSYPHKTTQTGLLLKDEVRQELKAFLKHFLQCSGYQEEGLYFRIDAFIGEERLYIIEVNVELQDGWGVALNLIRASGNVLSPNGAVLPKAFTDYGNGYKAEFELACSELALLGVAAAVTSKQYYLAPGQEVRPPKHEMDSKMYLARFASRWDSESVIIPRMYCAETTPWDEIPEDVIFKFCHKYGAEALKARYSVIERSNVGKAKFVRKCYNKGTLVAQERVSPLMLDDGSVTQAVIMCAGTEPVTGYLQVSPAGTIVINDKTAKAGPLLFVSE